MHCRGSPPRPHASLAREILASGGALVTELHSRTRQNGSFFLARNRIIAALSAGTIVVESGSTGGSLVTAQYADSYDRTVMAVPGRATDTMSAGTNTLIRNRKAQLILTAADVIREMGWDLDPQVAAAPTPRPPLELTRDERGLLGCFRGDDPQSAEELAALSGLGTGETAALLVGLELAGAVRQLPGNRYERLRCD